MRILVCMSPEQQWGTVLCGGSLLLSWRQAALLTSQDFHVMFRRVILRYNGVFLNVSLNSPNSETKIFVITVKGLEPATQLPLVWETSMLPQCQQDTYMETGSLNWAWFMLQWFSDSLNLLNSVKGLLYTLRKVQKILPYALKSENTYLLIVYGGCFHSLILRWVPLKSMLYP